jgi:hypothetical protein
MNTQGRGQGVLVVSSQCTNCRRLLDSLSTIKNHGISVVEYSALTPTQKVGIEAVPTLVLNNGKRLVGTDVFKWLAETHSSNMEIQGFSGFDNANELVFSDFGDSVGYCKFSTGYAEL